MKKILFSIFLLTSYVAASAQDLTSYFMDDAADRMQHNAAFAPDRGYFNIPLLGGINLNASGNITLGNMLYNVDGELVPLFDGGVSKDVALSSLDRGMNSIGFNNRMDILSFGFYSKSRTNFWSFDLAMESNMEFGAPYEFFEFMKSAGEESTSHTDINNINMYGESYAEVALGYSRMINDRLTVGARVKLLAGLVRAELAIDEMDVDLNEDKWSVRYLGSMNVNAPGGANIGLTEDGFYDLNDIDVNNFTPAGWGGAIDLGATYDIIDNLQLSAGINDLGFISWSESTNSSGVMTDDIVYEGVSVGDEDSVDFEIDDLNVSPVESKSIRSSIQANLNLGAEYDLFSDRISAGLIYSARFWRSEVYSDLTAAVTLRPISWFTFSTSYAFTNNNANALGLAVNFSPCWFNLYLATNIITSELSKQYIPVNQSNASFTIGLGIPLGRRSLRSEFAKDAK